MLNLCLKRFITRAASNFPPLPFRPRPRIQYWGRSLTVRMDTTSTKRPEQVYHWLDDVEDLERYVAGGYHPTHLGDEFSEGRYRIVHKLGFGGYSTGMETVFLRLAAAKQLTYLSMACQRPARKTIRRIEDHRRARFCS